MRASPRCAVKAVTNLRLSVARPGRQVARCYSSTASKPTPTSTQKSPGFTGAKKTPLLNFKKHTMPSVSPASASAAPADVGRTNGAAAVPKRKHVAYIALGSNIGNRVGDIERACNEMTKRGIRVTRTSCLYETEPMYVTDQDKFINAACEVETTLEPIELLDELQSIETYIGRKPKVIDKGPRAIDLDILLYDDIKFHNDRLTIPHVGIAEREFVLRPLAELIPNKPLDSSKPWHLTIDALNALPPSPTPISTYTPLTLTPSTPSTSLHATDPTRPTRIMAILNVTPDSFSDGGKHTGPHATPEHLTETTTSFLDVGASIIDIGGQSTAPGAKEISAAEELSRVIPAVQRVRDLRAEDPERPVIISVDTYRAVVAEDAVAAGADMINDVSAGGLDPDMLPTVARLGCTVCLMHMRGTPATMSKLNDYDPEGLIPTIARELCEQVAAAEAAGIRRWRIVLDPGLGFAKRGKQNVEVLRRLEELREWPGLGGLPWLVGSSRKNFIGEVTGVGAPKERVWGTAATVAAAVERGADVVRVHDVREMAQVARMADAIWRY